MPRRLNAGQNRKIKMDNKSPENVDNLIYWGTTVRNQNFACKKIKRCLCV
jgi:hypothetical protein